MDKSHVPSHYFYLKKTTKCKNYQYFSLEILNIILSFPLHLKFEQLSIKLLSTTQIKNDLFINVTKNSWKKVTFHIHKQCCIGQSLLLAAKTVFLSLDIICELTELLLLLCSSNLLKYGHSSIRCLSTHESGPWLWTDPYTIHIPSSWNYYKIFLWKRNT